MSFYCVDCYGGITVGGEQCERCLLRAQLSTATLRADKAEADATAMREALNGVPLFLQTFSLITACRGDADTAMHMVNRLHAALDGSAGSHLLDELEAAREAVDELRPLADGGFSGMTARQKIAAYDRARAKRSGT